MKTSPFLNDDPEVRRAEKVFEKPPGEELPWHLRMGLDLGIKFVRNWLPRQLLKGLTAVSAALGGGALADDRTQQAVILWTVTAVCGGLELLFSLLAKQKALKKVAAKAAVAAHAEEKLAIKKDELIETRTALHEVKAEVAALKNGRKATTT